MTQSAPARIGTAVPFLVSLETRFGCAVSVADMPVLRDRFDEVERELHRSADFIDETMGFAGHGDAGFLVLVSGVVYADSQGDATRRAQELVLSAFTAASDVKPRAQIIETTTKTVRLQPV